MMEENKHVTIYDIAAKLNLATSTISRALKDHHTISDKTKRKVRKAAKEMGFVPNTLAAGLRGNKTKTIGVLIPTITEPFLSSLISGIEIAAQKANHTVIIMQSHDSYIEEVNMAKSLFSNRVSGVICSLSMETQNTSHFHQFSNNNIPLVFVDRVPKDYNTFRVVIDNYSAGYRATKHLIEQGCTRIAHFTAGSELGNLYSERKRGYLRALQEHNIEVDDELIIELKSISYEQGVKASTILFDLKSRPDGLFAPGDMLGVSAVQTAKRRNIKVPEEFKVIGFNDDLISKIIEPNLSTITHPAEKMGEAAAEIVIKSLRQQNDDEAKEIIFLNTEVLARESTFKTDL